MESKIHQIESEILITLLRSPVEAEHFNSNYLQVLSYLRPRFKVQEISNIEDCDSKNDESILVVYLSQEDVSRQREIYEFIQKSDINVGVIVVFESSDSCILESVPEALLHRVLMLSCPVSTFILNTYIYGLVSEAMYKKLINKLKSRMAISLREARNIEVVVKEAFSYLKECRGLGYTRASASLLDRRTAQGKRYLLKIDPETVHADRNLQKDLDDDSLMKKVDKETVCIIEDLKTLRQNPESLLELGWSDNEVATQDINSWIGLAAKSHGKTIAFITLDHKEPKHYKSSDHQFIEFLKDVGEIFADTIQDFFLRRNRDTLQKIISNVGESLSCEDLVDKILEILKESLQCDSCKYFYISNDPESENRESFLEEKSSTHKFKKGMGIVGAAWESGESLIIPHAFEDNRFLARPNFQGDNVSMLAVPVIPVFDNINNAPRRTIGVICCHKKKIDYFTVYDRDLVDEVVRITATIIERTRILGFFDKISSKMLERVGDSMQVKRLLQDICEYALRVTNAGSASIHLLKYISNDGQASIKGYTLDRDKYNNPIYYTFPPEKEESPRLNGEGVTDYLIQELTSIEKSIEFSIDDDTMFNKINKKQRDEGVQYKLLVPLLVNRKGEQCSLIGVLYLNKYVHEPFSSVEKFAVELFANQAATIIDNKRIIEDQKSTSESNNKLFEQIQSSNKILAGLYRSLAKIVVESPQEMLSRAVTQTRESLNAKEVIVILINEKDNTTSIVPDSPVNERINISLKEKSIKVYEDNQKGRCNNTKELLWQEFPEIERNGLYILFTAGSHCLGVMWILFTGGIPPQNYIDDHTEIYKLYANQIALAYDNAKQFESLKNKSKDELHKQISLDYKNARRSSNWFFYVSLASSIVGLFLIFGGANKLLASPENGAVNDQNAQNAISVGALLQAVTVLAFQQSKSANDRVDQYHKELYNTGKLSILLSATEQLEPDLVQQEKKQIIQATTQSWMHHDIKETSEN